MFLTLRSVRRFSSTLAVLSALAAAPAPAHAEDGYDLWLRYAPIESVPLRDAYRQAIAGVVVQQSPETAAIVTKELARGLKGLLGADVPAWT
jgi:alpha-glucuronidase